MKVFERLSTEGSGSGRYFSFFLRICDVGSPGGGRAAAAHGGVSTHSPASNLPPRDRSRYRGGTCEKRKGIDCCLRAV